MWKCLHVKYSCRILMKLDRFSKKAHISSLVKIRPVWAELFHADGRTDGRTGMTKLIVALRSLANAPWNGSLAGLSAEIIANNKKYQIFALKFQNSLQQTFHKKIYVHFNVSPSSVFASETVAKVKAKKGADPQNATIENSRLKSLRLRYVDVQIYWSRSHVNALTR